MAATDPTLIALEDLPLKTKPREHQWLDLKTGWLRPAWGRYHEMRTGKGVLTVYEMDLLARAGIATRFLVVCPKKVISTWHEMIGAHASTSFRIYDSRLDALPKIDTRYLQAQHGHPTIVLLNYDRVWKRHPKTGRTIADPDLMRWAPEYVVADEAHKIKNRTSKRAKALHVLGRQAKYRRALAGTPDPTSYADYYSIVKFLDPGIFGLWSYFENEYLILDWYKQITAYRNVDKLARLIHSVGSRVTRMSAGLDVPPVEDLYVDVALSERGQKVYEDLAEDLYAEISSEPTRTTSAPITLTKLMRLAQVTGGYLHTDEGEWVEVDHAKQDAVMDSIEEATADAGAKVVVYFRFRAELAAVAGRLGRSHIRCLELHGDTKDDSRIRRDFEAPTGPRVLLAQIGAGSLGLNLSAAGAAKTAIFYSWDYDSATYQQARDRIWEEAGKVMGGKLTYIHLRVPGTIDDTMLGVAQKKIDRSTLLLDRWRDIVGGKR